MKKVIDSIRTVKTRERSVNGTFFNPSFSVISNIEPSHSSFDFNYLINTKLIVDVTQSVPIGFIPKAEQGAKKVIVDNIYGETRDVLYRFISSLKYKDIDNQISEEIEALALLIKSYEVK